MIPQVVAGLVLVIAMLALQPEAAYAEDPPPPEVSPTPSSQRPETLPPPTSPAEAGIQATQGITVYSYIGWQTTGLSIAQGARFEVGQIGGAWTIGYRNFAYIGPSGYSPQIDGQLAPDCKILSSVPYGTLLGRVGNGAVFAVGNGGTFTADTTGVLSLRINDADICLPDNDGYFNVVVSTPPDSLPDRFLPPFPKWQTWYVCRGYNVADTDHEGVAAIDLSISPSSLSGPTGCSPTTNNASSNLPVVAPAAGTVSEHVLSGARFFDMLCLDFDKGNGSALIGHLATLPTIGSHFYEGEELGRLSGPHGGHEYAHIHIQVYSGRGCYPSPSASFTTADGFRFECANDMPNNGIGNQYRTTALFNCPLPPPAPLSITAKPDSANQVTLRWADGYDETGYRVYRWSGNSWTLVRQTFQNVTQYVDIGLSAGETYFYAVCAVNWSGEACPTYAVEVPTFWAPVPPHPTSVTSGWFLVSYLTWSANFGPQDGFNIYEEYCDLTNDYCETYMLASVGAWSWFWIDTSTPVVCTNCTIRRGVSAYNTTGESSIKWAQ